MTAIQRAASTGARVATFPSALLGAAKPLRAFIGHVQPTFNWTLQNSETAQILTAPICTAMFANTYLKKTLAGRQGAATDPRTNRSACFPMAES